MTTDPLRSKTRKPPAWVNEALTGIALTFLGATALMLGLEHAATIWPSVSALGYWDAFFLVLWADVVINASLFGARVKIMEGQK